MIIHTDSIPILTDNYIWLIQCNNEVLAVDPGDAAPLIEYLKTHQLNLSGLLITYHHKDHTGGIYNLRQQNPSLPVYGPANIIGVSQTLSDGDKFSWQNHTFTVLAVPGHTDDHLAYYTGNQLFCGDTLFALGCGRHFEGSISDYFSSIKQIAALPDQTLLYPAHEYTLNNLRFALAVEPENKLLICRGEKFQKLRNQGQPTLPVLLYHEKQTNPFLRTNISDVKLSCETHIKQTISDELSIFTTLRRWKDSFQ